MKTRFTSAVVTLCLGFSLPVMAQMNHSGMQGGSTSSNTQSGSMGSNAQSGSMGNNTQSAGMQNGTATMTAQHGTDSAMGEGMVKKVDKSKGTVTLAHGAMNGMPAMTMAYKVKDAAMLDKLQVGQKIRFATDPADGGMTVTRTELVK